MRGWQGSKFVGWMIVFSAAGSWVQGQTYQPPASPQYAPVPQYNAAAPPQASGSRFSSPAGKPAVTSGYPPADPASLPAGYAPSVPANAPAEPLAPGTVQNLYTNPRPTQAPAATNTPPAASRDSWRTPVAGSAAEAASGAEKTSAAGPQITVDQVKQLIVRVEESQTLNEEQRKKGIEQLNTAIKWLDSAAEYTTKAAQFRAEAKEAPERIAAAKAALAESLPEPVPMLESDATLPQLEQGLRAAEERLKGAQDQLAKNNRDLDPQIRAERKAELAKLKETTRGRATECQDEAKAIDATTGPEETLMARRTELQARAYSLSQHLELIDAERQRSESLAELFPLQRDHAQRHIAWAEKLVASWREIVAEYRKQESQRQAEQARQIASEAHPAVRTLAESNALLAESRTKLAKNMELVSGYLESVSKTLDATREDYKAVTDKVKVAGMTPTTGLLLRSRRDRLPDDHLYWKRVSFTSAEMQVVQVELLELEAERAQMANLDQKIEHAIEELGAVSSQFKPGYLAEMVRGLMEDRRKYLDGLLIDYNSYHDDLSDLDLAARNLLKQLAEYRSFIDERVLWTRSTHPLNQKDVTDAWSAVGSLIAGNSSGAVLAGIRRNLQGHAMLSLLLAMASGGMILFRGRIRSWLAELAGKSALEATGGFVLTIRAFAFTLLMAAIWPVLLWSLAWWLALDEQASELTLGIAAGLKSVALTLLVVETFRQICRSGGVGERHFHWPAAPLRVLYRSLLWLMLLGLPMMFVMSVIETHEHGAWRDSLGRTAFLFGLAGLAVFLHYLLRPWNSPFIAALQRSPLRWPYMLRHAIYALVVGTPVALSVLLLLGYVYTVDQLMLRLGLTLSLMLGLVLLQALAARGLQSAWYQIAQVRAAWEAREQSRSSEEGIDPQVAAQQRREEMARVHQQLGQLVRGLTMLILGVGAWCIWDDMVPALQVIDRVELWSTNAMVDEQVAGADGTLITQRVPKTVPTTLADLLLCIVTLVATYLAVKTLPGLLEISILARLPLDKGARNALTMISRYVVTLLGMIVASNIVGISWSSVQWLAAAMTVGLGFGLQEIFANMVSGLIILFERPIRIGDLVTVNGTTGKVTRMQIRATTITDFDRRELVVPNKRFITEDVVNWTLSDPVTRFVIPVGISYSSDPTIAYELLLGIAKEHSLILDEPAPTAVFVGFGASTLDLELRAFLASRDDYGRVLHEVNVAIERQFREAGIEIAFPQQDIHIRSITAALPLAGELPGINKKAA